MSHCIISKPAGWPRCSDRKLLNERKTKIAEANLCVCMLQCIATALLELFNITKLGPKTSPVVPLSCCLTRDLYICRIYIVLYV